MLIHKDNLFPNQCSEPAIVVLRQDQPAVLAWLQITELGVEFWPV